MESRIAGDAGSGGARRGRVDTGGAGQVEDQTKERRVALPGGPLQGGETEGVLQGQAVQMRGGEQCEVSAGAQ